MLDTFCSDLQRSMLRHILLRLIRDNGLNVKSRFRLKPGFYLYILHHLGPESVKTRPRSIRGSRGQIHQPLLSWSPTRVAILGGVDVQGDKTAAMG